MRLFHHVFSTFTRPSTTQRVRECSGTRYIRWVTVFLCLFMSAQIHAQQLTLASSGSIPPYVYSESDTGIQLDIIREALTISGHTLKVMYLSNKRGLNFLKTKNVDGVINVPAGASDLYYSDSTIEYQNGITVLKNRNLKISDISDLHTLRVIGFQNASNYFGKEFKAMTQKNDHYDEVVNQLAQLNMLFRNRCDAIVMDHRIFDHYFNTYKNEPGFNQATVFYNILPPSPRYVAFHNEALRDQFNKGLKQLKNSGRYQAIINSYLHQQHET